MIGLGKSVPNRATERAGPNTLSATSRIAILKSNKPLTLASGRQGTQNRTGEAALIAGLLNFCSRSWEPFRLLTSDEKGKKHQSTTESDTDIQRWAGFLLENREGEIPRVERGGPGTWAQGLKK